MWRHVATQLSSGQSLNHVYGTSSKSAHLWDPKKFTKVTERRCRSQCPRGLRCRSAAARLLTLWVRIPPGAWMFVCGECCVLSGRGLCDELISRPEESYWLCSVVVCDLEASLRMRPWPALGCSAIRGGGQNVDTGAVGIIITTVTLEYICVFFKRCSNWQYR